MQLTIIGAGMSPEDLTQRGKAAIDRADCILGAPRLIAPYAGTKPCIPGYRAEDVTEAARRYDKITVLMSGDTGFYSGAAALIQAFPEAEVLPGISSVAAFFARCGKPWQEAALVSAHGKALFPAEPVRRNRLTFFLTGGNVPQLGAALTEAGFGDLPVWMGENLGAPAETVTRTTAAELSALTPGSLTVLLVENPAPDARVRVGIADEAFLRRDIPMTKQAVRAQIAACFQLAPEAICWDVGCGTGSVTVELALSAYRGQVFACDAAPEAAVLTRENCRRFHISNVAVLEGYAPDCLASFPRPDAVFIGGSKGALPEILRAALDKNPHAAIVLTAIALETLSQGMAAMEALGLETQIIQISAAQARPAGKLHLMMGANPTFLLTGKAKP